MQNLKRFALSVVFFIVALFVISVFLPSRWKVERQIVIKAEPAAIFPLVSSFKNGWVKWSAFDFADPDIQYIHSGPDQGAGATRSWTSQKMGNGTQVITGTDPQTGVDFEIRMSHTEAAMMGKLSFSPAPEGGTLVTWYDEGQTGNNPLYRWMSLFTDRMMGPMFEESLQNLKTKIEAVK